MSHCIISKLYVFIIYFQLERILLIPVSYFICMDAYLNIVERILTKGRPKSDRTGIGTISITGERFYHDMSDGFPLLTTKKMYTRGIWVELEGFIHGITDKKWYQDRGCTIWNEWCNPSVQEYHALSDSMKLYTNQLFDITEVKEGHYNGLYHKISENPILLDELTDDKNEKDKINDFLKNRHKCFQEQDLGAIYGFQWRHFGADYKSYDTDYSGKGIDLFQNMLDKLDTDPCDRGNIVTALNPSAFSQMALRPCHFTFQVLSDKKRLDLIWYQRSIDTMLGLPYNIASYATLLKLLAKESGQEEGSLVGLLGDVHIYNNHINKAKMQLDREPKDLPIVVLDDYGSIYDWNHDKISIVQGTYNPHKGIRFPIAT